MSLNKTSANTIVLGKSDKATKGSLNQARYGQNNVVTSNKFQVRTGGKSFFNSRRNNITTSSGYHPHHHTDFHRKNSMNTVTTTSSHSFYNKKNKSADESIISGSSCTENKPTKKMMSIDSVNSHSHGCGSSQTSGHASRSQDSFDMKDIKAEVKAIQIDEQKAAEQSVQSLETLQQIQEAKPGNKRALIVDLPPYLYSIPALASFFEPYGEVAMLQILPQKRMWDADLIDLLGASMCNRLANQSLCAVVEFYSARMAKFIIGILRKRLPILKFRCALLKPSAAIELTNQAENLGLSGVVIMKNKPKAKTTISNDSRNTSMNVSQDISDHEEEPHHEQNIDNNKRRSESESGCEDISSSSRPVGNNQRLPSYAGFSESDNSEHTPADQTSEPTKKAEGQRFVTSFQIKLGR